MTAYSRYVVTVDPVDTQTVYIGTGGEGVFKSENGGESWSPMRNGMAGQAIIWAIAVDPVDNRIIYAGANSGVFRSTDKGNLWTKVSNGLISGQVRALVIDDRNHNVLYAGVAQSVYMTVDVGSLWTPLNEGFPAGTSAPYVSALAQRVGSASVLLAGTTNGLWTRSSPAVPTLYRISGHVTDASGVAIPDVAVAAHTAGSATTDASGSYTISGLVTGTYTLTPSKSGYIFSPASRTVSMPPNSSQQDFIGAPLPPRLRLLYVPLDWEGSQDSFDAEARTQSDIFIDGVPLKGCRDRVSVETLEVTSQNFAAFTCSLDNCGVSGVRTFVSDTLKISPSDYDVIVGLAESSPCAPIAGCSNGTDTIWVTEAHDSVTAHELGHIYGLEDEYCSNQAGSTDSRCNDGDSQRDGSITGDVNWLDASQPSDCPADGSNDSGGSACCNFGEYNCSAVNYGVCCLGNKNAAGGRSTMSYANAPEPRGFDSRDQAQLSALPALSCEATATAAGLATEGLTEDAFQTVLDVHLRVYNNDSVEKESISVIPGRPTSSSVQQGMSGDYLLSILNDAGDELWAQPFPLYFDYTGPTVLGADYSGINYAVAAAEFRIPYQCGMKTLKLYHGGALIFSDALPVGCMTSLPLGLLRSGADRLLNWEHLAADVNHYEVHRSDAPYFNPDDSSLQASVAVSGDCTLEYLDINQAGADSGIYYVVIPIGTSGWRYPASTRVGGFNYALIPGTTP